MKVKKQPAMSVLYGCFCSSLVFPCVTCRAWRSAVISLPSFKEANPHILTTMQPGENERTELDLRTERNYWCLLIIRIPKIRGNNMEGKMVGERCKCDSATNQHLVLGQRSPFYLLGSLSSAIQLKHQSIGLEVSPEKVKNGVI